MIVDDLNFKNSNKIFLKTYLENHHEGASLNTKACCSDSYHRLEVVRSGPRNRAVVIYSEWEDNRAADVMVWVKQPYKKKQESVGRLYFEVEEEIIVGG